MPWSELAEAAQGATDDGESLLEFPLGVAGRTVAGRKRWLLVNDDGTLNTAGSTGGGSVMRVTFTDRSGTIAAGGTAQTLAAANAGRNYLEIQNNSTGDLWINWTTTAVVGEPSLKLPIGATYVSDPVLSTERVSIIGATTGQTFTAKEA